MGKPGETSRQRPSSPSKTRRLEDDRSRIRSIARRELKFVVDTATALRVEAAMAEHGVRATSPQGREVWFVRSNYFDDDELTLTRQAHAGIVRTARVREREYFDDPWTAPPERAWLEIKWREGENSEKLRFPIPRDQLGIALASDLRAACAPGIDEALSAAAAILAGLCGGRPFALVACVEYRRRAVFVPGLDGQLGGRVTLDTELSWRLPRLSTELFGHDARAFVEVKDAEVPPWLALVLGGSSATGLSKFVLATSQLTSLEG